MIAELSLVYQGSTSFFLLPDLISAGLCVSEADKFLL